LPRDADLSHDHNVKRRFEVLSYLESYRNAAARQGHDYQISSSAIAIKF
jgi:hypothetical protein